MIKIRNLHKKFGKLEVLKGIDVDVKKGEIIAIIGPSGSGKSTFLRCINRLEEPSEGDIVINGKNIMDKDTDINLMRQELGMVFQHFNLFPHKTVMSNITLAPMKVKKISKENAEKKAIELLKNLVEYYLATEGKNHIKYFSDAPINLGGSGAKIIYLDI